MKDDVISRQAAIDAFYKYPNIDWTTLDVLEKINALPSAQPEPCEDAVNRQRLLNDLKKLKTAWKKYPVMAEQIKGVEVAIRYVETIPSVTPKRKTGKWKKIGHWGRCYRCDQCGNILDFDGVNAGRGDANFCPNCGADMNPLPESCNSKEKNNACD